MFQPEILDSSHVTIKIIKYISFNSNARNTLGSCIPKSTALEKKCQIGYKLQKCN